MTAGNIGAVIITFSEFGLGHGDVVNTQFLASNGLTISANIVGGGPDKAIIFDSTERGTEDPDLEGPGGILAKNWSGGNLPDTTILGNVLIIAENDRVNINLGGSAAIDNLNFTSVSVPEPASMFLLGAGLIGFAGLSRRFRKKLI